MIDSHTESITWAETFDRDLDDVFAVQDEITMSIGTAMQAQLTEGEAAREHASGTSSLKAWEYCLRASELADRFIKDEFIESRRLITVALEADPGYSLAWATLSWINWQEAFLASKDAMDSHLRSAQNALEKSLEIDPENSRALIVQAFIGMLRGDEVKLLIDCVERAVEVAPGNAEVLARSARTYLYAGKLNQALDLFNASIRLSPICPAWVLLTGGINYERNGDLDKAIDFYRQSIDLEPESPLARYRLIHSYIESGHLDQANQLAGEIQALDNSINIASIILLHSPQQKERQKLRKNLASVGIVEVD